MKVLICGSRDWNDGGPIFALIKSLPKSTKIVHGGASGAEALVDACARLVGGFQVFVYPANWKAFGIAAGPIRNGEMISKEHRQDEKIDRVYAFQLGTSPGTGDMIKKALDAGIEVMRYDQSTSTFQKVSPSVETLVSDSIDSFRGEFGFLSNFHPSTFFFEGRKWKTVEHAYHASKTFDQDQKDQIMNLTTPGDAKKWGRNVELRPDWDQVKYETMLNLIRLKFENPLLMSQLLATGDRPLVEGNTWNDFYWGICRGKGENNLGKILMQVRDELRTSTEV
jgi:ribA/ribD-fused uncharacterized protein